MKEIELLPHHLIILENYRFKKEWCELREGVIERHGCDFSLNADRIASVFHKENFPISLIINGYDSICSPELSNICKKCVSNHGVDAYPSLDYEEINNILMNLESEKERLSRIMYDYDKYDRIKEINSSINSIEFDKRVKICYEYRVDRFGWDKDYEKAWMINSRLDEIMHLFFYGLEPIVYDSEFLREKIICLSDSFNPGKPLFFPLNSNYLNNHERFPLLAKVYDSGLVDDFAQGFDGEEFSHEWMTDEEINVLKEKYPGLFRTVGSNDLYYEVLKILPA